MKKILKIFGVVSLLMLTSCNKGGEKTLTVLTNRTDVVDTKLQQYAKQFEEETGYKVEYEAITDYPGVVKTRLNSKEYGDVLYIPPDVIGEEYSLFFEELGTVEELSKKYNFINKSSYNGIVYGIPAFGNASGIVYNKSVFKNAGVQTVPSTPDEFLEALKTIKSYDESIIPLYTNYKDGWPLDQWEANRIGVAGDPNYIGSIIVNNDDPFNEDKAHGIIYKLMYDVVKEDLIENDYTTTDWESSKVALANGEIATMVLGSWAIGQVQELASDTSEIGYMPFPYTNIDGNMYSTSNGDYAFAINKYSDKKEIARQFIDFHINDTDWAEFNGTISTVKGGYFPDTLSDFEKLGVILIEELPAEIGGILIDEIDSEAEIGFWVPDFKKVIVETAKGNNSQFNNWEEIKNHLNKKWNEARN